MLFASPLQIHIASAFPTTGDQRQELLKRNPLDLRVYQPAKKPPRSKAPPPPPPNGPRPAPKSKAKAPAVGIAHESRGGAVGGHHKSSQPEICW